MRLLQGRLESAGIQMSDAALGMRDLASVQKEVGVFDPLAQLPNVPVLKSLVETIDLAQSDLGRLTGTNGALSQMANVSTLQIDQTIPPDETEGVAALFARREVPLPDEKVLLRQFTPPPDDGTPWQPPPPEGAPGGGDDDDDLRAFSSAAPGADAGGYERPTVSGAGELMLPEQS